MNRNAQMPREEGARIFFLLALLFAAVTLWFHPIAAAVEAAVVLLLIFPMHATRKRREKEFFRYLDAVTMDIKAAARGTIMNAPIPVALFHPETDDIIWTNDRFLAMTGKPDHLFDTKMSDVIPTFQSRWLLEGKLQSPEPVALRQGQYLVFGNLIDTNSRSGSLAMTYWVEVSHYTHVEERFKQSRPVVAVILIDNYEDLMRGIEESERAALLSELNKRIGQWAEPAGGILLRYDRDHYLFLFEEEDLPRFQEEKWSILEAAHQVRSPNRITATLSFGVARNESGFRELLQSATLSLEMALSRGGDQVVIKNREEYQFVGGRAKESDRRSKVKSRVIAKALSELLGSASNVIIMGHKSPDMDVMGACAGLAAITRKKGLPTYILRDNRITPDGDIAALLAQLSEYEDVFLDEEDALEQLDQNSIVLVVDTNRPEQVQSEELLREASRVVVIDHHRRAATFIDKTALSFQDPYASSASELVVDLIQHILDPGDLLRQEAEAILAGIILDTKNFTLRTGSRTFEAAAYLRRSGAETTDVKRFFQSDLSKTVLRYHVVGNAELIRSGIAVAVSETETDRITAAKAADELLNITGINASFVLAPLEGQLMLSARSAGDINVQVIAEMLGGGGNAAAAGAQLRGISLEEGKKRLKEAIDRYFNES
ncbi:MAG: family phosphoesterase [Firmicutes bacterium]|nr:family phosphoesterase [Bacillota bacterium]